MNCSKLFLALTIGSLFFVSCSNDDAPTPEVPLGTYDNGVLVLNQGGFGHGDATVSYISSNFLVQQNDIFSIVNPSITLGDTGQDIGLNNEFAYIVVNVSNKIQIVNRYTMQNITSITEGLKNPRYIAFANGKGYVTNWGDGGNPDDDYVAVIDLSSNTVTSKIPVLEGPDRIIENDGKLYVAQTGGWGYGTKVTVIDAATNKVTSTIAVGDVPDSMQIENGNLWVACTGNPSYASAPAVQSAGSLVKVSLATNQVLTTYAYTEVTKHLSNLVISGSDAYFTVDSGIYKFALSGTTLPEIQLFSTLDQGVYGVYSFAINNNNIYVGDAGNYSNSGKVYVYSMTGTLNKTYSVGVVPAGFYFNE